eukprot:RCo022738
MTSPGDDVPSFSELCDRMRDPNLNDYERLGVAMGADSQAVRQAFLRLALVLHPDKHCDDGLLEAATEAFPKLQKAYEVLGNERSRQCYDSRLCRSRTTRFLMLMDMGGSLLLKTEKLLRPSRPRRPDFSLKRHNFYVRPYCREFLTAVLAPEFGVDFALYTTRQAFNAQPQVLQLGQAIGILNLRNRLFHMYAGDEFGAPDPTERYEDGTPKMNRSLPRIWAHPATCGKPGVRHDECTTLNIDSTARKVRDHPENSIVLPSYEEADVVSGKDDRTLLQLRDYLARLVADCWGGDIREYLRMFPFDLDGRGPRRVMMKLQALEADPVPRIPGPRPGPSSASVEDLNSQLRNLKM